MQRENEKEKYEPLKITALLVYEDVIRTSYGNDGNTDGDWEDDNTQPVIMG